MSKAHVKALERVREQIESREVEFICRGLEDQMTEPAREVRAWIQACIGGSGSVGHWLRDKGHRPPSNFLGDINNDHRDMIAYRLRWIDSMIKTVRHWCK